MRRVLSHVRVPLQHQPLAPTHPATTTPRHFCHQDGSLHLLPHESSSLCPLRPLLTRVTIKELIHFLGLCYLGGSSPSTQQAPWLLSDQQPRQKNPPYSIYNFIYISASAAERDSVEMQRHKAGQTGQEPSGCPFSAATKEFKRTFSAECCVLLHN